MGLDMYLSARKYINKVDWNKLHSDTNMKYSEAILPEYANVISAAGLETIDNQEDVYGAQVQVNVAYWRKSNQIHNWFVDNVQKGEDDCGEYYVSREKLNNLLSTCQEALKKKDPSLLPPREGFFFGGTDIDEWYWSDIKETISKLKRVVDLPDFEDLTFYYQSSW